MTTGMMTTEMTTTATMMTDRPDPSRSEIARAPSAPAAAAGWVARWRTLRATSAKPLLILLFVQGVCTVFFTSQILFDIIGFPEEPISWRAQELIEIGAAIGLLLGFVLGAVALTRSHARQREVEESLRAARGAFHDLLSERFREWGLTPAETDVAFFVMKGFSTQEIAGFRGTSEGTVKAQTAAIYRKSGSTGRAQLVSLFIDDLMSEQLLPDAAE